MCICTVFVFVFLCWLYNWHMCCYARTLINTDWNELLFFLFFCCFFFSSSSSSSYSTTVCCVPWPPIQSSSIPNGLWPVSFILITFKSSWILPLHLLHDLSLSLVPFTVAVVTWFGTCWFCILSAWSYYLRWRNFINFTISALCNTYFISRFAPILQHFPPFTGTHIFLTIFHSNILNMFISPMLVDQAYKPLCQYEMY